MSLKTRLRSQVFNALLDGRVRSANRARKELARRIAGKPHAVSAFLQLDDPYSYLLSLYLPSLAEGYDIELRIYLVQALGEAFVPRADLLAEYAATDCRSLAGELGVPFLDKGDTPVIEHRRALLALLARHFEREEFSTLLFETLAAYWRGDTEAVARLVDGQPVAGEATRVIDHGSALLRKMGHYSAAMLHYGGEWYWGVDRLHHLLERLQDLGAKRSEKPQSVLVSIQQAMQFNLPATVPARAKALPSLEMFHSFRSPYSYLALERISAIAEAFGLSLRIRPVLPMVMRGLPVPKAKILYIAYDAEREARRLNIPFGKFSDPIGKGTERCLAVFAYASQQGREWEFVRAAGNAIWNEGVDVATDKGLRRVTEQSGMFWPEVVAAMNDDSWREAVERNRCDMMEAGMWGVPTFRLGDVVLWGQDRTWMLARQLEDLCHDGEGILE